MTQFLDTPVDKSLSATGAWTDIDISGDVPVSATGAIFEVVNTHGTTSYQFGLRKKGSTDNIYKHIWSNSHIFAIIGIDVNRKCQGKIEDTSMDFHLVGYTEADATFFTNAYDKSQTTLGAWTDLDLSSELPAGSVAAIFQVENANASAKSWSLRKKGSTDDRYASLSGAMQMFFIIGVDTNRKCQFKIETVDINFYLVGYLTLGASETNGIDRSIGSTGSYVDITESNAPSGATGAFGETASTGSYSWAARKNGSSGDFYKDVSQYKSGIFVGLDSSKKWEGKIENTGVDFYTLGYFALGVTTHTKTFTADVILQATSTKTFTADVIPMDRHTKIFTADMILKATSTKTFTADVILQATSTKTFTADILLVDRDTKTFTADVILQATSTKTFTADVILQATSTKTFTADTILVKRGTKTFTADVVLDILYGIIIRRRTAISQQVHLFPQCRGTKTFTADVVLKATSTKTFTADVLLIQSAEERGFYYAKLGSTILTSLKKDSFRITEELNKIPSFEFEISNCSANRTAIAAGITDTLTIYRRLDSTDTLMFTGRIDVDAIEYLSLERIRIPGYASYIDLNFRFHQHLNSEDAEDVGNVFDYDKNVYAFYKKGAVNATTAGAQSNYQLELIVGESSGSSGTDVHCEGHCEDFPKDIRFTKEDGSTKHDYWIEKTEGTTPNRKVSVWIEVASIPASGSVDFYMYYGYALASAGSHHFNTFGVENSLGAATYLGEIIPLGSGGAWDDDKVFTESLDYDSVSGKYWICYHDNDFGIGIAYASDIEGTWTKHASNPLLVCGGGGAWDDAFVLNGCMYIDKNNITGHRYWIAYEGNDGIAEGGWKSGLAYCDNIETGSWTKYSGNPILAPSSGKWDDWRAGEPSLIYDGSQWVLYYMGESGSGGILDPATEKIGYATAPNITGPYTKYSNNPVITPTADRFDHHHIGDPTVILTEDGTYVVLYTGVYAVGLERGSVGIQTTRNLTAFTKWDYNPVISIDDAANENLYLKGGIYETEKCFYITYSKHSAGSESGFLAKVKKTTGFKNPDIALNQTATASGHYLNYIPQFALNGDEFDDIWIADAESAWLKIDLGSVKTLGAIMWMRGNWLSTRAPEDYKIEISEDDISYIQVTNITGNDRASKLLQLEDKERARYIKLTITKTTDSNGAAIGRFSVYESSMKYVYPEPTWGAWGGEQSGVGGSYVDYATAANNDTINDVLPTLDSENDALYIGQGEQFFGMQVKYSTKGVQAGSTTVVFEFSKGSGVWSTLDVLDETRAFTEDPGTYYITIPHKPSDWAKDTVNSVKKFWIRARVTAGSYTTPPKLDRIKIMDVNERMVYYLDTAADSIMNDILAGTGYSMDGTDVCPSDTISMVGESETKLRFIAGVANALTWDDNGNKKAYQWWIDTSKKVHFKPERGTVRGNITQDLVILNNVVDYFNLSNRLFFYGNYDGANKVRAVIEDITSQDTHAIREIAVSEERYNNYIPLKEAAQKAMTHTKAPLQKIPATLPTTKWLANNLEVGDTVTIHQPRWNIDAQALQIVRADIGPSTTKLDIGISQEHLDGLKASLQRRLDISGIRMHGSTTLLQFGPETMNYQRVNDTTVYPARLKFEIPSDARYIHKVLISWKLGPYRADVTGGAESEGHDHTGWGGAGGAHEHGGSAGAGGAHTSSVVNGGLHTPTELSKVHKHKTNAELSFSYGELFINSASNDGGGHSNVYGGNHRHSNPDTSYESSHGHSAPSCGSASAQVQACTTIGYGTSCTSGACVDVSSTYFSWVATSGHNHSIGSIPSGGGHDHSIENTGYTNPSMYIEINTTSVVYTIYPYDFDEFSLDESPGHIHTINQVQAHPHTGVAIAAHANHVIGTQIAHGNHSIITQAAAMIDMVLGIIEIAGGTVMQLTVNGEDVTTVDGDGTNIVITSFCNSGANTVEIAPILGSVAKGGATLEGRATVFLEAKKF